MIYNNQNENSWIKKIAYFFFPDAFICKKCDKIKSLYNIQKNKKLTEIDTSKMTIIQRIAFFFFPDAFV